MRRSLSSKSSSSSLSAAFSSPPSTVNDVETPLSPLEPYDAARDYVMVIGGLGYIGSHTTLELLKSGKNVIVVDNLSNAFESVFTRIQKLSKDHWAALNQDPPSFKLHKLDYRSPLMRNVLGRYMVRTTSFDETRLSHIVGVIHFAAYKSVSESIQNPLDYYLNNVCGLCSLLVLLGDFGIYNFVFSSSATVYGTKANEGKPLHEEHLVHHPEMYTGAEGQQVQLIPGASGLTSPYGRTKYFGEAILADVAEANPSWRITALRYFNPVGCEETGLLGEDPRQKPTNLFPVISQVLTGKKPILEVFGSDWETNDGTAVRDFIHVSDLALGHLAALKAASSRPPQHAFRTYNLGTGNGSTVAEVIACMETASERTVPRTMAPRRAGDVGYCVAMTERATRELGWQTKKSLSECASSLWRALTVSGQVSS